LECALIFAFSSWLSNDQADATAKCVVVDAEQVLVSSANFTKAGQERNIEVGLKIQSPWLAQRLIRHFELLREHGLVVRAF
jgi:phosphatidylserine/phosphatidylglycerophosphate/cardiolipin synthase-like enzyme